MQALSGILTARRMNEDGGNHCIVCLCGGAYMRACQDAVSFIEAAEVDDHDPWCIFYKESVNRNTSGRWISELFYVKKFWKLIFNIYASSFLHSYVRSRKKNV